MGERFQSLKDFYPHYLNEHRDPISRRLHFAGTTGFFASVAVSTALSPIAFPAAVAGMVAIGARGLKKEKDKRPLGHVLGMLALPALASPIAFPAGVACAYGCAWLGHFGFEKNRPATFQYPLMSLVSDFKMWGEMARGRLWRGEDPAGELGLAQATANPSPVPEPQPMVN